MADFGSVSLFAAESSATVGDACESQRLCTDPFLYLSCLLPLEGVWKKLTLLQKLRLQTSLLKLGIVLVSVLSSVLFDFCFTR